MKIKIAPSLLACDIANLCSEIKKVDSCTDMLHIDVMDGHFVPNLSFGVPVVKAIRSVTDAFLDVHLMIDNPLKYIEPFIKAGADLISFHIEAPDDAQECINLIKSFNKKCAIAINPDTSPSVLQPFVGQLDMVLQMTVFPGFGGQGIVESAIDNIPILREMFGNTDIQIDGGIYADNCAMLTSKGANVIVSGTGIFGTDNPTLAALHLKEEGIRGLEK